MCWGAWAGAEIRGRWHSTDYGPLYQGQGEPRRAHCSNMAPKYVGANKTQEHGMALKAQAAFAVQYFCRTVDTPGAACHPQFCRARGVIRDLELSRLHGKAIDKTCSCCNGTGLRPIPVPRHRAATWNPEPRLVGAAVVPALSGDAGLAPCVGE